LSGSSLADSSFTSATLALEGQCAADVSAEAPLRFACVNGFADYVSATLHAAFRQFSPRRILHEGCDFHPHDHRADVGGKS